MKTLLHDSTFTPPPKDLKKQQARHSRRKQRFERQHQALEQLRKFYLPKALLTSLYTSGPGAIKAGHPLQVGSSSSMTARKQLNRNVEKLGRIVYGTRSSTRVRAFSGRRDHGRRNTTSAAQTK